MAKAKSESQAEKKAPRTPLGTFVQHQVSALEETGKAFASLLPTDFRTHAGNALKETRTGFEVLVDGVINTVEDGLDCLRSKPKPEATGKDKVKVDVD